MTDNNVPLVDTHVHFWDLAHPDLSYGWLAPGVPHPILGDIEGIKHQRFDVAHLWAEARFANVEAVVHVQAAVGTADPVAETRWIQELAETNRILAAHVAHADLAAPGLERQLDAHGEFQVLRGIRDFSVEPLLASGDQSALDPGLRLLAERRLLLDLDCEWPRMRAAAVVADRHPDLVIVLEHLGYPRRRDADYFDGWRRGVDDLSVPGNVHCKISGIGMGDPRWSQESIAPWIQHCLDAFGPDRCVFGSNWPVDRMYSSYDAIVTAYRTSIAGLTVEQQHDVLHRNARRLYRI